MSKHIVLGGLGVLLVYVSWKAGLFTGQFSITGMLMLVVLMVYVGAMLALYVLPLFAESVQRLVHSDPGGEQVDDDPFRGARALTAQGEYHAAVERYEKVLEEYPEDRMGWTELSRLQSEELENLEGALETLSRAQGAHEWTVEDRAFLHFRKVELLQQSEQADQGQVVVLLQEAMSEYEGTRHEQNARRMLKEMGVTV